MIKWKQEKVWLFYIPRREESVVKKWIVWTLCIVLAVSMAACSNDKGGESSVPTDETVTTTAAPEETLAETEGADETVATEDPGYDSSWASNDYEAQISDPALQQWEEWDMNLQENEEGESVLSIVAYPAGQGMDYSTTYNTCVEVRNSVVELAAEMRYCGFTLNEVVTVGEEIQMDKETWLPGDYTFEADNAEGYHCVIRAVGGEAGIEMTITKIFEESVEETE